MLACREVCHGKKRGLSCCEMRGNVLWLMRWYADDMREYALQLCRKLAAISSLWSPFQDVSAAAFSD